MGGFEHLSDAELLFRLRTEYHEALQLDDFAKIDREITPTFWSRFRGYYDTYTSTWKRSGTFNMPTYVVIDPKQQKALEQDWMDRVLKGQIDISF